VNQGFSYNLINQISLYAGFTPELSFSKGKSPFINTSNLLFVEYHLFVIYRKEISPRGDSLPPLGDSIPPLGESFPPLGEPLPLLGELLPPLGDLLSPLGKSFPPLGDLFPLQRELFPLKRKWWLMHRKSFVTINIKYSELNNVIFLELRRWINLFFTLRTASLREPKDKVAQRRERPLRKKIRQYMLAIT